MLGPEQLAQLDKDDLQHAWQRHRMFCLELAAKLGAHYPNEAIEMAETLSVYILVGKPRPAPPDEAGS
jgi:hypothetical protein